MKVPKYILEAARLRAKYAELFDKYDLFLSMWCETNGVETETEDTFGGVDAIVNPFESSKRVIDAIKNKR